MKLLAYVPHYVSYGHNAGGEVSLHALLRYVKAWGHDVTVLLSQQLPISNFTYEDIDVIVPQNRSEEKCLPFQYFSEADVILTQLMASQRAGILARQYGKPSICYIHNDYPMTLSGATYNTLALYNTQWIKDKWSKRDLSPSIPPGMVLHPLVDPNKYTVDPSWEYITLINLSDGSDKQHHKGSAIFYELVKRFPQYQFMGVKGAYGKQAVEDHSNLIIEDHKVDLREVYQRSKVILVPSGYESYGRVCIEAACSGIPSILADWPGTREAMGFAGNYCDYSDIDAWETVLLGICEDNFEESSTRARARANEQWDKSQDELEEFSVLLEILESETLETAYEYLGLGS